jgi:hypothetical protein
MTLLEHLSVFIIHIKTRLKDLITDIQNSVVFWDVTQRRLDSYWRFRITYQSHLDAWRRDQCVVPKRLCKSNARCVTSQKTTEFRQTAAEAYNLATYTHVWKYFVPCAGKMVQEIRLVACIKEVEFWIAGLDTRYPIFHFLFQVLVWNLLWNYTASHTRQ